MLLILSAWVCFNPLHAAERQLQVLIVRGAEGEPAYAAKFEAQVKAWQEACTKGQVKCSTITALDDLKQQLSAVKTPLWLVMIGHGTFDGREAKFNLAGPDLSLTDLTAWLKPLPQEIVIINNASGSGAFIKPLAGPKRIILSATKSANELSYPRFGEHLAQAIGGLPEADLDHDAEVSLLEAFLYAARKAAEFYETNERIATEHALIEDNGDGNGSRAEGFEGTQPKDPKSDGARAQQLALVLNATDLKLSDDARAKRDTLETQVRALVLKKDKMKPEDYYRELETLFVQIAKLQSAP